MDYENLSSYLHDCVQSVRRRRCLLRAKNVNFLSVSASSFAGAAGSSGVTKSSPRTVNVSGLWTRL